MMKETTAINGGATKGNKIAAKNERQRGTSGKV